MSVRLCASAAHSTILAAYHEYEQDRAGMHALSDYYRALPGHVASHVLDFSGGNVWGLSFISVSNDRPGAAGEDLMLLVVYGEEVVVLVYDGSVFKLSSEREEDAEYDCEIILTADPAEMVEMDAFGIWFQLDELMLPHFIPY